MGPEDLDLVVVALRPMPMTGVRAGPHHQPAAEEPAMLQEE